MPTTVGANLARVRRASLTYQSRIDASTGSMIVRLATRTTGAIIGRSQAIARASRAFPTSGTRQIPTLRIAVQTSRRRARGVMTRAFFTGLRVPRRRSQRSPAKPITIDIFDRDRLQPVDSYWLGRTPLGTSSRDTESCEEGPGHDPPRATPAGLYCNPQCGDLSGTACWKGTTRPRDSLASADDGSGRSGCQPYDHGTRRGVDTGLVRERRPPDPRQVCSDCRRHYWKLWQDEYQILHGAPARVTLSCFDDARELQHDHGHLSGHSRTARPRT